MPDRSHPAQGRLGGDCPKFQPLDELYQVFRSKGFEEKAVSAALGSIGMLAFALLFWLTFEKSAPLVFLGAAAAWTAVSVAAWWIYKRSPWRRRLS